MKRALFVVSSGSAGLEIANIIWNQNVHHLEHNSPRHEAVQGATGECKIVDLMFNIFLNQALNYLQRQI
jgi:hypothetical protein